MTVGIPTSDFPIQVEGDGESIVRDHHLKWIAARRQMELARKPELLKKDVLGTVANTPIDAVLSSSMGTLHRPNLFGSDQREEAESNINEMLKSSKDKGSSLFLPTSTDVLFGRGRPYQEHAGNVRFSTNR